MIPFIRSISAAVGARELLPSTGLRAFPWLTYVPKLMLMPWFSSRRKYDASESTGTGGPPSPPIAVVTPIRSLFSANGLRGRMPPDWSIMSIQPGDTYRPVASISRPAQPVTCPIRAKRPSRMATSARIHGLPAPSSTRPFRMTTSHGQAVGSAWPATGCGSRRAMQRRTTASGPQRRLVRRTRMEEPRVVWGGMPGIVALVRLAAATVTASRQKVYGTVYSMMRPGPLKGKPIATTPFGAGVTKVLRFAPPRGYHDVYKFSGSIVCDVRSLGAGPLARRPSLPFQVRHQEAVMRQKGQPPARGWTRVRRSLSRGLCWTVPALLALVAPVEAQQSSSVLGTVVSSGSLRPLAGAQVYVEGTDRGTLTDANGRFALTGLSGSQVTINVVMIGYREVSTTVPVGATDVRIELSESALALDQIVVTGQVGGTQRRAIG